jgi:hypothetical protein
MSDASIQPDPQADAAQAEWDATTALDAGADPEELTAATATGDDPAHLRSDDDDIPAADLRDEEIQPESQGENPLAAELGEDGQGDLAPEDL